MRSRASSSLDMGKSALLASDFTPPTVRVAASTDTDDVLGEVNVGLA